MWSDNETVVDLLNVQHIVAAVLSVVRDPRLSPITAGVYGDWGSGKSSVIRMVQAELDADPQTVCVYFNGWRFEGYEDAKVALAASILEALQYEIEAERGKLAKVASSVSDRVKKLLGRVDRLRLGKAVAGAGVNAGLAAGSVVLAASTAGLPITLTVVGAAAVGSLLAQAGKLDGDAVMSLFKEQEKAEQSAHRDVRQTVRDFRQEFERLVIELPLKRLVVVVDDLDRCLPPNVIETFEAIRLFLAVPNTAFVVAADELVMRYAVAQRYPAYDDVAADGGRRKIDVGGRYLEKFVQVPVRIPPLSSGDLHGYLNLLFAERHAKDPAQFPEFCRLVREATAYDQVAFRAEEAEKLLGVPPTEELKADLALAEQIAPVLAVSAEGNPRQTKRFLNALLLRMEMAKARNVVLDRAIAAKLLLLEYFQPIVFASLAQSAIAQDGVAVELQLLEEQVEPAAPVETEAGGVGEKRGSGKKQPGVMTASESHLPPYTVGLIEDAKFRAWLASEPRIGTTDLRPYIHFSAERFIMPVIGDQRLSPAGQDALRNFLAGSEILMGKAAERISGLLGTEVSVVISALGKEARRSENLKDKTSPLYALFRVAEVRHDSASEVLRMLANLPVTTIPAGAAIRVFELAQKGVAQALAEQVLERWAGQMVNKGLQTSAKARLEELRTQLGQNGRKR